MHETAETRWWSNFNFQCIGLGRRFLEKSTKSTAAVSKKFDFGTFSVSVPLHGTSRKFPMPKFLFEIIPHLLQLNGYHPLRSLGEQGGNTKNKVTNCVTELDRLRRPKIMNDFSGSVIAKHGHVFAVRYSSQLGHVSRVNLGIRVSQARRQNSLVGRS